MIAIYYPYKGRDFCKTPYIVCKNCRLTSDCRGTTVCKGTECLWRIYDIPSLYTPGMIPLLYNHWKALQWLKDIAMAVIVLQYIAPMQSIAYERNYFVASQNLLPHPNVFMSTQTNIITKTIYLVILIHGNTQTASDERSESTGAYRPGSPRQQELFKTMDEII